MIARCRAARWRLRAVLILSLLVASGLAELPARADERSQEEERLRSIQDAPSMDGFGGSAGFFLKQVGGPVLLADDENYAHDPASAIKVLAHLQAMRSVQEARETLNTPVVVYRYPSSRGGDPESPTMCPVPADETQANSSSQPLARVTALMMQASDNRMTRAAVLRYGLDSINALAARLGMESTRWDQPLVGCGYQDGKRNALTLRDAAKLYEAVADGSALSGEARRQFWGLMTNQPVARGDHLLSMIQDEARSLGKPEADVPVAEGLVRRWKGGSYDICTVCLVRDLTREVNGLVSIPFRTGGRTVLRHLVYGVYVAERTSLCPSQPCAAGERLERNMFLVADEMLRTVVREALKTW